MRQQTVLDVNSLIHAARGFREASNRMFWALNPEEFPDRGEAPTVEDAQLDLASAFLALQRAEYYAQKSLGAEAKEEQSGPPKGPPTGFVATCRCGAVIGALDYIRTARSVAGELLGIWLHKGCVITPRFDDRWTATVESCRCPATNPATDSRAVLPGL
jgi:hypothetical protein